MGLHQRHTHARVLRDEAATEYLAIEKRDSHRHNIMLNVPDSLKEKVDPSAASATDDTGMATLVSVVYVTMSPTFTGPVVGYTTLTSDLAAMSAASSSIANAGAGSTVVVSSETAVPLAASSADPSSNNVLPALATSTGPGYDVAADTPIAATSSATYGVVAGVPLAATRAPTVGVPISQDSRGMTGGAKAGLAIGIILAIALAAGLVFFCYRRKKTSKQDRHEQLIDEKHASFFGNGNTGAGARGLRDSVASTASTVPRLSLRPVTQFLPMFGGQRGNALNVASHQQMSEKPSVWERKPVNGTDDPFADKATPNPFDNPDSDSVKSGSSNHGQKSSWEGPEPSTRKSLQLGTASAVPVASAIAGQAPEPRGPNNVHRIQLDFKPSMDDELELRSGELVRMLHEYDDGWALCIRMDRSQQGVTPRTCLSKLPVKPRPQGPAQQSGAPNGRPQQDRRLAAPNGMAPRPLTPTDSRQRSQTIDRDQSLTTASSSDGGRTRSNSMTAADEPMAPATRVPSRKPVPAAAL